MPEVRVRKKFTAWKKSSTKAARSPKTLASGGGACGDPESIRRAVRRGNRRLHG